jgi:hypothetical protein
MRVCAQLISQIFAALTSSDGYQTLLSNIGSDPMEPSMRLVRGLFGLR